MDKNYMRIGDLISIISNRNTDGAIDNLIGISIDKCYIPSVANITGTDLSNYKVISYGQFACSLMQVSRDRRIPIGMYRGETPAIMSPAYVLFEVSRKDLIMPEYMELWFKRSEFDREACFYAIGGVRGSLDWDDFCNMKLPVPSIEEQQKIVHRYNVIVDRIELLEKININLDDTIYMLFRKKFEKNKEKLFLGNLIDGWKIQELSSLADFKYGKMPSKDIITDTGYPIFSGYRIVGYSNEYMFEKSELIVIARGVSGTGDVKISPPYSYITNLSIVILLHDRKYINYLLYYLGNDNLISLDSGSAQSQITINDLSMHKIMIPPYKYIEEFYDISQNILNYIEKNKDEIKNLKKIKRLLLEKIS